jgi:hypothetical protein
MVVEFMFEQTAAIETRQSISGSGDLQATTPPITGLGSDVMDLIFGEKKNLKERQDAGLHGAKIGIDVEKASERRNALATKSRLSARKEALQKSRRIKLHEAKASDSAAIWEDYFEEETPTDCRISDSEPEVRTPDDLGEWFENEFVRKHATLPSHFDFEMSSFPHQKDPAAPFDFGSRENSLGNTNLPQSREAHERCFELAVVQECERSRSIANCSKSREPSPPIILVEDSIATTLLVDSQASMDATQTASSAQSGKRRKQSDKSTSPPLDLKRTALPDDECA